MIKNTKLLSFIGGILLIAGLLIGYFQQNIFEEKVYASQTTSENTDINNWLQEENFSGTAIIIRNNQLLFSNSYGYQNYAEDELNTNSTLYPVASLQKIMTAFLTAKAVAAGQLTYDTQLSQFYPEITGSSEITIRDLLNQTSGIEMAETTPSELLTTQAEQIDYLLTNLDSTTADDFHYTNANYTLLAGILATVSQKDYEELLTEEILTPLNLTNTYFWDTVPSQASVATAYEQSLLGFQIGEDNFSNSQNLFSSLLGAGNLLMTASDLVTLLQSLTDGSLLTTEELSQLLLTEGSYGGAFWQTDDLLQTNGGLGDYSASVYFNRSGENMVILLGNSNSTTSLSDLAPAIYQNYLD